MATDINKGEFDEATLLKLEIFKKCFKEWFPVFINLDFIEKIFIYDFFAGSGSDITGAPGSPLILLDVAKGDNMKYCREIRRKDKKTTFVFNEHEPNKKEQEKFELLKQNVDSHKVKCSTSNCSGKDCIYDIRCTNKIFKNGFNSKESNFQSILNNNKYAKFLLLDQYGFSQVDEDVFLTLVNSPRTDFIFFISSSFIRRFKEHPNTLKYINTQNINFDESNPKKCHITIAEYFEQLLPKNLEYYFNHFTIKKECHYYGLIFGTNHSLGMEKFLKVCWEEDRLAGESNCNTQNDYDPNSLFGTLEPNKIQSVKTDIKKKILQNIIKDNVSGLKYALKNRCLPKIFTEAVKELEKEGRISRKGTKSYKSTDIHKIKVDGKDYYSINIKGHEDNKN